MIEKSNITGIILAGGRSSRMGMDKGLLDLKGKAFVKYSIDALKPLVSKIIIVSNNAAYDIFNLERVEDIIKDSGPLAGIYTGLNKSKTEYNLVLSCDIPLVQSNVLKILIQEEDNHDIVQIKSNGRDMPLIALYRRHCENKFLELLQNNERRLHVAVNQCRVKSVKLNTESEIFTRNINTPEDLKNLKDANYY
jgi:molybdopterin-guanine dinucleotide biosynthesis protein A